MIAEHDGSALRQSALTSQLCGTRPVARNSGTGETNRRHQPSLDAVNDVNALHASSETISSRGTVSRNARGRSHTANTVAAAAIASIVKSRGAPSNGPARCD